MMGTIHQHLSPQPRREASEIVCDLGLLMQLHGTDKFSGHHYDVEYERHFAPLRHQPITLLEIGVGGYTNPNCGGESLKVWRDYFAEGRIVGFELYWKALSLGGRVEIWHVDQSKSHDLFVAGQAIGDIDIIIDDGSHIQSHVMTSFRTLFPLLKPGGIYVIEDLGTCYAEGYGDWTDPGRPEAEWSANGVELASRLCDALHHGFWGDRQPSDIEKMVSSVHMSKELLFIYKTP